VLVVLLTGLILTQGSVPVPVPVPVPVVGVLVAVVGMVIMARAAALFLRHGWHR